MQVSHAVHGSGEPLVLIQGLSQVGRRWAPVVERLDGEFRVVTLDNRETGGTGACPDGFSLADMAADVLELMTSLGHDRFVLAGVSMGGMIAQEVLRAAPERVRGAVLLATHGGSQVALPPDVSVLQPPPGVQPGTLESARALWTRLSGPGFAEAHPEAIERQARISVEAATPLEGTFRQLQAIAAWDPGDALVGIDVPVVVAHGDADPLVPYVNGVRLAERLGVELHTWEGTGHAVEYERTDEVVSLLRAHLLAAR